MKLQIDTSNKTIKIEESINLNDLYEMLNKMFPNEEWKEYKLETTIIQNWNSPVIIQREYIPPISPWWQHPITIMSNDITDGTHVVSNIYNLEIN